MSKQENDRKKLKKEEEKKTIREKESLGLMSPEIRGPDTKGPGIKKQEMVLPDRMEISPGKCKCSQLQHRPHQTATKGRDSTRDSRDTPKWRNF